MNIKPINQKKIIGYDDLFKKLINLYNNKKLPNKIIISGQKGIGKSTFVYHFINYIFSKNEDFPYDLNKFEINNDNKSFKLVKNFVHPNFFLLDLIDNKKNIEIDQIRKAIKYSQKSSFNNDYKIVLIDNLDKLNINSANALLKIIEEPNEKLIFFLIHDSSKKILETIKSRCIVFKKQFTSKENISITKELLNTKIENFINPNIINHYSTIGDFIFLYNFSIQYKLDLKDFSTKSLLLYLINYKYYKNEPIVTNLIYELIQFYFYKTFLDNKNLDFYVYYQNFIKKINYANEFNLDIENLFLEFKKKVICE